MRSVQNFFLLGYSSNPLTLCRDCSHLSASRVSGPGVKLILPHLLKALEEKVHLRLLLVSPSCYPQLSCNSYPFLIPVAAMAYEARSSGDAGSHVLLCPGSVVILSSSDCSSPCRSSLRLARQSSGFQSDPKQDM